MRWVKLHDSILEWKHFGEGNVLRLWLYLLLSANHEEREWNDRKIKPGQKLTSIRRLAEQLELSVNTIQDILKKLQASGEITVESDKKKGTLITINNYSKYQSVSKSDTPTDTLSDTQSDTLTDTKQEYKNIDNIPSPPPACVYDRKPIEEYMNELQSEQIWIENICMNNRISVQEFDKRVQQFVIECKSNGKDTADNINDAKSHFNSWLRIQLNVERKEKKNGKQNNESNNERLARIIMQDTSSNINNGWQR